MRYLARDIVIVRPRDDRELLKNVVHELRGDDDLDLPVHRLRPGVDQLARLAALLAFGRGLRQQQVLVAKRHNVRQSEDTPENAL